MNPIKTMVLTGLFTATASATMAADLPRPFLPPAPVIRDFKSTTETWYLRGDIGYVANKRPEADFAAGALTGSFVRESLSDNAGFGIGLGYRFNPNFRADITADYFNARFRGAAPTPTFATSLVDRGHFHSSTFLVNGYLDFGTFRGITPYVGAGIGMAHNVLSNYSRATFDAATGVSTWERLAGGDDYALAWALMAGVGVKLSSNFTLDLGYRYVGRGDVRTRYYAAGSGSDVESIGAHEVRLGMRYGFN